jgi:eukaryotic-like serine/threonine-protein kinase
MSPTDSADQAIFEIARHIVSTEARQAYLDQACRADVAQRQRIVELLQAIDEQDSFLETPAVARDFSVANDQAISLEKTGEQIGPYKLLQQIGEGGMGKVWMADQREPVRRRIALKLIKPGMDTRQVLARFEAERQALSMMDHPNIAKVLDAGTTESGRPFFVMELVKGQPITEYCDQNHLAPRERLELFLPVCHAIQHAHQKGIVHRDLKPSNVLIAEYDGRPVPKVIDFGVAKAIGHSLTDGTIYTGFGQIVGTLEYMSPEQAKPNQLDIDTRSDIYSLGVLLYELLTGFPPFDKQRLRSAAWDEILRIIREEEPPRPSHRLSSSESLSSVAANRKIEPTKLTGLVRGELDWIVMKALEKDRNRRYETANGFALDIQRYLSDEAVSACPPSAAYCFQKFARRNKGALSTAAAILGVSLLGTAVSVSQTNRAMHAERETQVALEAEQEQRSAAEQARSDEAKQRRAAVQAQKLAEDALAAAEIERGRAEENFARARAAVNEYLNKVTEAELLRVPGLQPLRRDLLDAALKFYQEFAENRGGDSSIQADLAVAHYRLALIHRELGNSSESQTANQAAIALLEALGNRQINGLETQTTLAQAYLLAGRYDETVQCCQEILGIHPEAVEIRSTLAQAYNSVAVEAHKKADTAKALKYHQLALNLREGLANEFPDDARHNAELAATLNNIGVLLNGQRKNSESLAMYQLALPYSEKACSLVPHSVLWGRWLANILRNLGTTHRELGDAEEALRAFERQAAVWRRLFIQNPAVSEIPGHYYKALLLLADQQGRMGQTVEANRSFRDAEKVLRDLRRETPEELFELAVVYASLATPPNRTQELGDNEAAQDERRRNADLALKTLRRAFDAGWADPVALRDASVFKALREREDFRQLALLIQAVAHSNSLIAGTTATGEVKVADQEKAIGLLRDIAEKDPQASAHRRTLARTYLSLGLMQTQLQQYDDAERSLQTVLDFSAQLYQQSPDDSELELDRNGARIALADIHRRAGRLPQAHRVFQECLDDLERLSRNSSLSRSAKLRGQRYEYQIGQFYLSIGLWSQALRYSRQNLTLGRWGAGQGEQARFASLFVPFGESESHRRYCHNVSLVWLTQDSSGLATFPEDLVWLSALNPQPHDELDDWVKLIMAKGELTPGDIWRRRAIAYGCFRLGRFAEVIDLLAAENFSEVPDCSLLVAMSHHALGNSSQAENWLAQAESDFRQMVEAWLTGQDIWQSLPKNWDLQIPPYLSLHVEASERIRGEPSTKDAWLHLIQARGYLLVGDRDQAAREMEVAVPIAARDDEIRQITSRVLQQWGSKEGQNVF